MANGEDSAAPPPPPTASDERVPDPNGPLLGIAGSICALLLSFGAFVGLFAWAQSTGHDPSEDVVEMIVEPDVDPASEPVDDDLGSSDAEAEVAE